MISLKQFEERKDYLSAPHKRRLNGDLGNSVLSAEQTLKNVCFVLASVMCSGDPAVSTESMRI